MMKKVFRVKFVNNSGYRKVYEIEGFEGVYKTVAVIEILFLLNTRVTHSI